MFELFDESLLSAEAETTLEGVVVEVVVVVAAAAVCPATGRVHVLPFERVTTLLERTCEEVASASAVASAAEEFDNAGVIRDADDVLVLVASASSLPSSELLELVGEASSLPA